MRKIMSKLKWLLNQIVKFLSTLLRNILATIVVVTIGLPVLFSWVTGTLDTLLQFIKSSTPLWGTIASILLCLLYAHIRIRQHQNSSKPPIQEEELHEEFGVYWNNQDKLRCLTCKWPLKCASKDFDPSIFFCSNCDKKHALRDKNGNHLTEAQAIKKRRKLPLS
jgi:hypothetical protein